MHTYRVELDECENVTVTVAARSLHVRNSKSCTIHCFSLSRPVILGECSQLVLGPYNSHYPALEANLTAAQMPTEGHGWAHPLVIGGTSRQHGASATCVRLEVPGEYFPQPFPFAGGADFLGLQQGRTLAVPFALPPAFVAATRDRKRRALEARQNIDAATLGEASRAHLQSLCDAEFNRWLTGRGLLTHITNLSQAS
jgi:hypothetical protein